MPGGVGPLTRESSALAVEFIHSKKTFINADPAVFLYHIINYESLLLAYWIPASGGDAACAGMTAFVLSLTPFMETEPCIKYLEISLRGCPKIH